MPLILDADAIIKLYKAATPVLVMALRSGAIVPNRVYEEVVEDGMAAGHADAIVLSQLLQENLASPVRNLAAWGISAGDNPDDGESEVLAIALEKNRGGNNSWVIVSDDRRFRRQLDLLDMPHLTTVGLVAALAHQQVYAPQMASEFLRNLRPMVREADYQEGMTLLEEI